MRDGKLATGCYWRPSYVPKHPLVAARRRSTVSTRELSRSVESMLVADVPLGAFVSGGVDSGLIAAMATRIAGRPIDTFNLGFTGTDVGSEHVEAATVARHIGARHHCLMLGPDDVLPALDRWVDVFDEPFGDQAALPTMLLAEYARREVTVVLTGEGADEVFGGYRNYVKRVRGERFTRVLGAPGSPLPWLVRRLPPRIARDRMLKAAAEPRERRYATIPNIYESLRRREYFTDRVQRARHGADRRQRRGALPASAIRRRTSTTCSTSTPGCGCPTTSSPRSTGRRWRTRWRRASRSSTTGSTAGARGSRRSCKIDGSARKVVLKALAERYLPARIVHRPKQGFMMPLERWLARELKDDIAEALGPRGIARRGLASPDDDRAAPRRAHVGAQEPRDAAVGAADPRALVRALRAGVRAVADAMQAPT